MALNNPPSQENEVTIERDSKRYFTHYWHRWFQTLQRHVDQKTPEISQGTAAPTTTPRKIGDIFIDTSTPNVYIAKGTASSADWKLV